MKRITFEDIDELVEIIQRLPEYGINKVYTTTPNGKLVCNGWVVKHYGDEYIELAILIKKNCDIIVDKQLLTSAVKYVANRKVYDADWHSVVAEYIKDKTEVTAVEILKDINAEPTHTNKLKISRILRELNCIRKYGKSSLGVWIIGN